MNLIDKAVNFFSPAAGERRIMARQRIAVAMNYDAASKGRRMNVVKAPATSADAAAYGSRGQLRNVSRDLIRNRPYAARARSVVSGNVVGTGIVPSIETADQEAAEIAGRLIRRHLLTTALDAWGACPLPAMQWQVMNSVFSDGEVLVRERPKTGVFAHRLPLPFQVQMIEADYLDTTKTSHGANEVVEGVELSPVGDIVAYHLYRDHPGAVSGWRFRKLESERVPASQILHIRRLDRPGQLRGVPWLAPVILPLLELSDYQEAQIVKQKMASLLAFFVEADPDGAQYEGKGLEEVSPGSVVGLQPGQKMVASAPPPVDGYGDFMKQGLHAIAMGIGVTYEALAGELRGVNFTSGRMGRIEMDRQVEVWQNQIVIDQFCRGIAGWFIKYLPAALERRVPDDLEIKWTAPRRPLVDPNKEIPAILKSIEGGLSSRQREQRRLGHDPDEIARERGEDDARDGQTDADD